MSKDHIRDYATDAFRYWASVGCPTYAEAVEKITKRARGMANGVSAQLAEAFVAAEISKRNAELLDIKACEETFEYLKGRGKECVCSAVRDVYMAFPRKKLARGELSGRVVRYSMENYYSERQVYYFLTEACNVFAAKRGLRGAETEL